MKFPVGVLLVTMACAWPGAVLAKSENGLAQALMGASAVAETAPAKTPTAVGDLFKKPAVEPDINAIPILASVVKMGGKLYYLGERSGLNGWLIVMGGRVQMIYATADGKSTLIGALFTGDGDVVTAAQVRALMDSNKEVSNLLSGAAKQESDLAQVGGSSDGAVSLPSAGAPVASGKGAVAPVALSPGERLVQDLQTMAGVTLGGTKAPQLFIVVDPANPQVQTVWKELRESVQKSEIQLRLIPIAGAGTPEERALSLLLQSPTPGELWDKYIGGDKTALSGAADDIFVRAIRNNQRALERWKVKTTPYIVYRAKDGTIKVVQGRPERMATILTDLPR